MSSADINVHSVPSMAKIVIRVINKERPDDVLVFDPATETDGFNVVFTQPFMNLKNEFYLEYDAVVPYVETFFQCLLSDTDAECCYNVQVELPGLPSVLLTKSGLMKYLALVFDSQMDTLRTTDWPMESAVPHNHTRK